MGSQLSTTKSVLYTPAAKEAQYDQSTKWNVENPELSRQLLMGNQATVEYISALNDGGGPTLSNPRPFPELLGTPDWYDARHADHVRRHRNQPAPPPYYIEYGKKYCLRFSNDLFPDLSPAGQQWLIKTRTNLQVALEVLLIKDPKTFNDLECRHEAFKNFAFGTHSRAYLNAGLASLPMLDLYYIAKTPDIMDLLSQEGLAQVVETAFPVADEKKENAMEAIGAEVFGTVESVVKTMKTLGHEVWNEAS